MTAKDSAGGAPVPLPPAAALPEAARAGWQALADRFGADDPLRRALLIEAHKCLLGSDRAASDMPPALRAGAAGLVAIAGFLATGLRDLAKGAPSSPEGAVWVFAHGPGETRSDHVLRLAETEPEGRVAIIAPARAGAGPFARRYEGLPPERRLPVVCPIRPGGLWAGFSRLPEILGFLRAAASRSLCFRDLAGMGFRALRGLAFAHWVRCEERVPPVAIFGHTGTAETLLPELALQGRGCRTVHFLHGKADGPAFFGISDVALCRSRFDARMLGAFGGYGRCVAPPPPEVPLARAERGWLVCSNLAHPMGLAYAARGVAAEIDFVRLVATARGEAEVTWRLHPAFALLPAPEQAQVLDALAAAGIRRGERGATLDAEMAGRLVVTPPSTVFGEAVAAGLPALLYRAPLVTQGTFAEAAPEALCFEDTGGLARIADALQADPEALDDARRAAAAEFAAGAPRSLAEVIEFAGLSAGGCVP